MSKKPNRDKPRAGWWGKAGKAPKGDAWHTRRLTIPRFGWFWGSEPRRPGKGPPGTSRGDK